MSRSRFAIFSDRIKRVAFGCVVVGLGFAGGCGSRHEAADEDANQNGLVTRVERPGRIPDIDSAALDAAVIRSIDEAVDVVRKRPDHPQAWGRLGMLLLAHDLQMPAAECFAEAGRRNPNEPHWPYFESIALRSLDLESAIERSRRAAELFGDKSTVPKSRLADMLIEGEQLDDAQSVLTEVIRSDPRNARARVGLAKVHLLRNEPRRALEHIDRARESTTSTRTMLLLASEAYRRLGNLEQAKEFGEQAQASRDTAWDDPIYRQVLALRTGLTVRLKKADRLFQQNRVDDSITMLERLVADYPESEWARILLARGYIRQRRLKEADATLREALRLNPDSFEAHFRMGVVSQVGGQHKQAVQWFEKSAQLQSSSAVAYRNIALSQFLLGDRDGAEKSFQRSVEVRPNYFEGHLALGDFYLKVGDVAAARAAFRDALQLRPGDLRVSGLLMQLDSPPVTAH